MNGSGTALVGGEESTTQGGEWEERRKRERDRERKKERERERAAPLI